MVLPIEHLLWKCIIVPVGNTEKAQEAKDEVPARDVRTILAGDQLR